MSANDWKDLIYKVFYFQAESPLHLQGWLEKMYVSEGLSLVSASGDYYIFKPMRGIVEMTIHPKCDRCGGEIVPGLVHYCMPETEVNHGCQ